MGGGLGRGRAAASRFHARLCVSSAPLTPHPALPHKGGGIQRGRLTPTIAILALAAIPRPAIADDQPEGLARVEVIKTPDGGIQPQAAADGRGTVHLLFFRGEPSHGDLYYAKRNPGQTGGFLLPIRVNSEAGSAIATGTIRGGQIALGPKGKVHVAWNGSTATPSAPAPMWYSRIKPAENGFEPQKSLMKLTTALDGGGTVAADDQGRVFVAWHARGVNDPPGEDHRKLWVARSEDEGATFAAERPALDRATGACACCGTRALADSNGNLSILFRSAKDGVERRGPSTARHLQRDAAASTSRGVGVHPLAGRRLPDVERVDGRRRGGPGRGVGDRRPGLFRPRRRHGQNVLSPRPARQPQAPGRGRRPRRLDPARLGRGDRLAEGRQPRLVPLRPLGPAHRSFGPGQGRHPRLGPPDRRGPARRGVHRLPLIGGGIRLNSGWQGRTLARPLTSVDEWANPLMRKSFALVLCGLLLGVGSAWSFQKAARRSHYTDEVYGFSLDAPRFPAAVAGVTSVTPIILGAPAEGGFSSNVIVAIQLTKSSKDAYREQSLEQFKQLDFKVNSEHSRKVSGRDAVGFDYQGRFQGGRDFRILTLAVIDTDRVILQSPARPPPRPSPGSRPSFALAWRASASRVRPSDPGDEASMKKLINHPESVVEEMVEGLVAVYPGLLTGRRGGRSSSGPTRARRPIGRSP